MRSDAVITVTCDRCASKNLSWRLISSEEIQLTATAGGGYDEHDVDYDLERLGWRVQRGEDICPSCIEDEEAEQEEDTEEE